MPCSRRLLSGLVTVNLRRHLEEPPRAIRYIVRVVTAIELMIGAAALLLIFFLVFAQALQRYLPVEGWSWTGELARFCLVWLTFVVSGVLVTRDGHISIEMIDAVPRLSRAVRVLSCLIVAAIGVVLTLAGWELVQEQGIIKSPSMQMPMSWLYAISMIGFVSIVVRSLVAAVTYAVLGVPEPEYEDFGVSTS